MTSININTISKKPNFINYFSEPITFPPNAQVALPKANFQVPIVVNPVIKIPRVLEVNYDDSCLDVRIDGVSLVITWRIFMTLMLDSKRLIKVPKISEQIMILMIILLIINTYPITVLFG